MQLVSNDPLSSPVLLRPIGYNNGIENTNEMHYRIFLYKKFKFSYYHHLEECFLT